MTWQPTQNPGRNSDGAFDGLDGAQLLGACAVIDSPSLQRFLRAWLDEQIACIDLPCIRWAYDCASRNDGRGLIDLDLFYSSQMVRAELRDAGIRVGVQQLRNLAPLRDQKLLRRYREAVEAGQASGHHAVVYGVFLHLYSIPLREGLLSYAFQSVHGFIAAAAGSLPGVAAESGRITDELTADLPKLVERSLSIQRPQFTSSEPTATKAGKQGV